jgi:hypothetical protein
MNKHLLLRAVLFLLSSTLPLLQADPLVALPAGSMSCSVAVTPHTDTKSNTISETDKTATAHGIPSITTVQITRTGKLQQALVAWSDGQASEAWSQVEVGVTFVEKATDGANFIYDFPRGSPLRNHFFPLILDLDAVSLNWINQQNFTGPIPFQGRGALHYQKNVVMPDTEPPRTVRYQAWVDPKTLKLLALDDGDALYRVTISDSSPSAPLVLPARFQSELQRYVAVNAKPVHS